MSRSYTPDDLIRILVKHRWIVLMPFAIGVALAPLLARFAPPLYRSETLIMVVPQRVPDNYVKATVTETVDDRLPAMNEQILSRSRLERIIQELDLYKELRSQQVMEDVVAKMRSDITPTLIGKEEVNSFKISYVSDNPDIARKVTEKLASLYIEQNIADRENQAESTSQFLETQLQEAKRRLVDHEKKLEEYRKAHAGQLPTQLQGNLQAIQNANLQLQSLNESTNRAQERRLLIERQIADAQSVPASTPAISVGPDSPAPTTAAQQLEAARARLAASLQRYTPNHPEVVSLQRLVSELAAKVEQEAPLGATPLDSATPVTPAEAAQKKRILDLRADLVIVDHQLAANRTEEQRLRQVIAGYQTKVDALPSRESELVELTRDYSTLQAAYASLLTKREDSLIAANLERRQIGEQFRILDPASKPEKPSNQLRRLQVMASGAGVGLALGLLLVGFREFRDSSFHRESEVHSALKLPVLALIPVILSDREMRAARWRRWAIDLTGSILLIAAVAVVVMWRLQS